jgi:hypothetical protein
MLHMSLESDHNFPAVSNKLQLLLIIYRFNHLIFSYVLNGVVNLL